MKTLTRKNSKQNHKTILEPWVYRFLQDYRLNLEAANRSPKTISWYLSNLDRYFRFLADSGLLKPLEQLGRKELTAYITHLQQATRWPNKPERNDNQKLSPSSIQGHVRAVKAFWGWLFHEEYLAKNPLEKYPLPRVPQKLIVTLSPEQVRTLLSSIDRTTRLGARNYLIILMLYDGGFRISELLNVRLQDIDMNSGIVTVVGKGEKHRRIPLSRRTLRELSRYINRKMADDDRGSNVYLFAIDDRKKISTNGVQQMLRRLKMQAGFGDMGVSPHTFRHSYATQFITNGGNVYALKELMGHASLQTTLKYVHLGVEHIREQQNKYAPVNNLF
jgi:site-specific recombinase XerD